MILVDSSVLIGHLRGQPTPQVRRLAALIRDDEDIAIGDLILCEVLQGVGSEGAARRIERALRVFDVVRMSDENLAVKAARNHRRLRALGVTLRSTIDLLIGTWCIDNRCHLLHADRDYDAMERHLGLSVLHP